MTESVRGPNAGPELLHGSMKKTTTTKCSAIPGDATEDWPNIVQ